MIGIRAITTRKQGPALFAETGPSEFGLMLRLPSSEKFLSHRQIGN
jgi:hypothetical protein